MNIKFKFLFILLPFFFNFNLKIFSSEIQIQNNEKIEKDIKKNFSNNEIERNYILDSGDILFINFAGLERTFTNSYIIDEEGFLFLPEIYNTYVRGLTIDELKLELEEKFQESIKDPKLNISIIRRRPVTITLLGLIRSPGLYNLSKEYNLSTGDVNISMEGGKKTINVNQTKEKSSGISRLYDAIRLGKGLEPNADLSRIIVNRQNSKKNGGGRIETEINLLNLLKTGDQTYNIKLYDGDIITVPEGKNSLKEQFLSISKFNISPDEIRVFVNGNVVNSGSFKMPKGSTLIEAIGYAGGEETSSGYVKFIRFDENKIAEKRTINLDKLLNRSSEDNIVLLDGDVIRVEKNIFGKIGSSLNTIGSPIINAYGIYSLFD